MKGSNILVEIETKYNKEMLEKDKNNRKMKLINQIKKEGNNVKMILSKKKNYNFSDVGTMIKIEEPDEDIDQTITHGSYMKNVKWN